MTATLQDRFSAVTSLLEQHGQTQLLTFYDELDDADRATLLGQIENIDWPEVDRLIGTHVKRQPVFELAGDIAPAPFYPADPTTPDLQEKYARATEHGEQLIRQGQIAAFVVAGGQGTRLGWDGPKGTYPATPIRQTPLFVVFAEYLLKLRSKYGAIVPWYVMTSPINHGPTVAFFEEHDYFGLGKDNVKLFPQAMMPAIDPDTGKCLLASKHELALSPNGHGGSLKALWTSGAVADMKKRGVTQISYFQVDNPLVKCVDPLFVGLHALDGAGMSSKALPKRDALEPVGNFATVNGKMSVIEYTNMPEELARQTTADGGLRFNAGSIAIHMIALEFVEQLNTSPDGFALPWNRAHKKVPYFCTAGKHAVQPDAPNAVKLETFVFDALPLCETSIVLETKREEEFAPIKNAPAPGAQDSPDTSKQLQSDRAKRWLETAGVDCAADVVVELKPTTAIGPADLAGLDLPAELPAGSRTVL